MWAPAFRNRTAKSGHSRRSIDWWTLNKNMSKNNARLHGKRKERSATHINLSHEPGLTRSKTTNKILKTVGNVIFDLELSFTACARAWCKNELSIDPSLFVSVQGSGMKYAGLLSRLSAFMGLTAPTLKPIDSTNSKICSPEYLTPSPSRNTPCS